MTIAAEPRMLAAQRLQDDPRVEQARQLLLAAVADHQSGLTGVRPPNPALAGSYAQDLAGFGAVRGASLYFPYLSSGLGNGPFVELGDGSVKLDLITGIGVHGYGHSHPDLISAGVDAAISDTVMQGNLQQDANSWEFSRLLVDLACESGADLRHCLLSTSGAMANENSLKIAFQKRAPADRILSFEHCFAGRTLALAWVTDKAAYRVGLPETVKVDFLPFFDHRDPAGSTRRTLDAMEEHLHRYPGRHAALWMELIQGEGGYFVGDRSFFTQVCELAKKHGIVVIDDEVQTFCRTTRPYAFQHFGLDSLVDIVTIGKLSQVCATLFTPACKPQPGLISQTFTGSTWSILAGRTIVEGLIQRGHFGADGRNAALHRHFVRGLEAIASRMPDALAGPWGIGGMVGMTPFGGSMERTKELCNRLFHAGLMSFFAGADPARLRFLLPLGCVTEEHIDLACSILETVLRDMQNG